MWLIMQSLCQKEELRLQSKISTIQPEADIKRWEIQDVVTSEHEVFLLPGEHEVRTHRSFINIYLYNILLEPLLQFPLKKEVQRA